jgi:hypothetical protein
VKVERAFASPWRNEGFFGRLALGNTVIVDWAFVLPCRNVDVSGRFSRVELLNTSMRGSFLGMERLMVEEVKKPEK